MKRNLKILEINSGGGLYCYKTATKGWKGNKRLISWFKRFVKELTNVRTK